MAEKKFPWGLVVAAGAVAAVGVVAYIKREEIKEFVNKVIVKIEDEIIEEIVEEEGYCELDTDGDGEVDTVVLDTDGDGDADTIVASICEESDFAE
ncbi:MAG: hypothetical protein E7420_06725 [Ruminococcaceae bacterium]|nr:hypothetical protein [Oscillospiraceae bacterium]MBR2880003.1 hypothetical protein [Oscillospiraceae bacterium]